MLLRYTDSGYLVILPEDDPHRIVDAMLATGYDMEFCVSPDFSPEFVARLMEAGFLVMSTRLDEEPPGEPLDEPQDEPSNVNSVNNNNNANNANNRAGGCEYVLLPKLHIVRSALFFENIHVKKSIRRFMDSGEFELGFDAEFDVILKRCIDIHGDGWLTPPLVEAIKAIRSGSAPPIGKPSAAQPVYPASFALYRGGKLVSGQFGVIAGKVYTGYSTYHDEDNAGTIQLICAAQYLHGAGYRFFDMGMPLPYKNALGAVDISPQQFVALFRP